MAQTNTHSAKAKHQLNGGSSEKKIVALIPIKKLNVATGNEISILGSVPS